MKAKQYELGYGCLGNGVTVWNRKEEVHRDYRTIAHISDDGTVKIYDDDLPEAAKAEIRVNAEIMTSISRYAEMVLRERK